MEPSFELRNIQNWFVSKARNMTVIVDFIVINYLICDELALAEV